MTVSKNDITIVIPTYNKEKSIAKDIEGLKQEGYQNILVVEGHSKDNTLEIAKQSGVNVISHNGHGKCGAIKAGMEYVSTPYVLVMDAGLKYNPKDIEKFLQHIEKNEEIIGIREEGLKNITLLKRFGNWIINKIFFALFGKRLHDVCSGMYMLKTEFARQLNINTPDFCVETEIAAKTIVNGGNIEEIPVDYESKSGEENLLPLRHGSQIIMNMFILYEKFPTFDPRLSTIGAVIMAGIMISSTIFFNLELTSIVIVLLISALFILTWAWGIIVNLLKVLT